MVRGARACMDAIKDYANINNGETSADGLFTLTEVECLGLCERTNDASEQRMGI